MFTNPKTTKKYNLFIQCYNEQAKRSGTFLTDLNGNLKGIVHNSMFNLSAYMVENKISIDECII